MNTRRLLYSSNACYGARRYCAGTGGTEIEQVASGVPHITGPQ